VTAAPEPLRVLFVSHSALPGGHNGVIGSLLRHRPGDAACRCIFLEPGPVAARLADDGFEVSVVDSGRARQFWNAARVVRSLRHAIREHRADVVFAHVSKAQLYCSVAARLERTPSVWWNQEGMAQNRRLIRLAARLPARDVICSSDFTAAELRGHTAATVHRIHLGPELDGLDEPHRHTAGPAVFGNVGRLQRWKRVELAIQAMPRVVAALPGARLRVVGGPYGDIDSGYPDELRRLAATAGVVDAVEFTGEVEDAGGEIAALDVMVHTSLREPFGLVMVEAMLRGVPVVASDEGGPSEIVRDGVDGMLVNAEDPDALATALIELGRNPERRAALGEAGRERALANFTAARMSEQAWRVVRAAATGPG
jgi:glycosyltransferase involved in cell wall biosynthesis